MLPIIPCILIWSTRNSWAGPTYLSFKSAINNFYIKLKGESSKQPFFSSPEPPTSLILSIRTRKELSIPHLLSARDHSSSKHRRYGSVGQTYCFFSLWMMDKIEVLAWPSIPFPDLGYYLRQEGNVFFLKQMSKIFASKRRIPWTSYKLSLIKATKGS